MKMTRSLSDLKNRSENTAGRGQILTILQVNNYSIDQKSGEIWTGQADLQPISFKSDRLPGLAVVHSDRNRSERGGTGGARSAGTGVYMSVHEDTEHRATPMQVRAVDLCRYV